MFFGGKRFLGLDLGSSSIKMAELEVSRKSATLLSFGFAPTPPGSIQSGEINDVERLSATVAQLHQELHTKRKDVVTGMWGTSVIVKKVTTPKMEESLLAEQVRWEAEQYIPFDLNDVSLEFTKLPSHKEADAMDVVIVAARTELVNRYVNVIQSAGLVTAALDVSGFALANCFEFNYGKVPEQIALLNIGANVTNFVVVDEGHPVFTRDIPVGGFNYNSDIQSEMNISAEEAESMKISAAMRQPVPGEVVRIMSAATEYIAKEIHSTVEFYNTTSNQNPISRVFVAGGSSVYVPLIEEIAKQTGLPVEPINPFAKVQFSKGKFTYDYIQQIQPFAVLAVGLALRRDSN